MPPNQKLINLNVEVDVLTAGLTAEIVIELLEFLLYQRNQIPFTYKTYKYYINSWLTKTESDDLKHLQRAHQRQQATKTRDSISAMQTLIWESFEQQSIKSLRFLFGATSFTPKEAYTVHIPLEAIAHGHSHEQHRLSQDRLGKTLLALLTTEELYSTFSSNLCPTNVYLELEMQHNNSAETSSHSNTQVFPKDICQLPLSCKDVHLHLLHTRPKDFNASASAIECCKALRIYEDLPDCNQDDRNDVGLKKQPSKMECSATWWESEIIVRGFKEKPIKGVNIWSK